MADMMICPKTGKCKPVGYCDGKEPHKRMDGCKQWYCPITGETIACIPSPTEPACPVCGHPVSEHRDGRSGYKGCYHNRINNVPLYCECECSPTDLIPSPSEPAPQPQQLEEQIRFHVKVLHNLCKVDNCPICEKAISNLVQAIAASQQAETAAMREALTLSRKHIGHLLQNPDKYKKTGETHEVLAKIDTALKGGK